MAAEFEGKVALVTGAGSGIGRVTAMSFAAAGASVAVCDLNECAGQDVAEQINRRGQTAVHVPVDVADADSVKAMVQQVTNKLGGLDCAFNNAGISEGYDLESLLGRNPSDFSRILASA